MKALGRMAARDWYGRHATGSVILQGSHVVFHGSVRETNAFLKLRAKHK